MGTNKIRKGLRLPITGAPAQEIDRARVPKRVAVVAADFVGMKPTMRVQAGDEVRRGQVLFEDKKTPGVRYTAPAAGTVSAVNRGDRRALQSVVIDLARAETEGRIGSADQVSFASHTGQAVSALSRDDVRSLLVESGEWTALRARPFGRVPSPESTPSSIFVTAIDTNPLAAEPQVVLADRGAAFRTGLQALGKLTDGPVFVCTDGGLTVELPEGGQVRQERFSGPHPAGTAGLHIHTLDPVSRNKTVWHIGYQDVIAIGDLVSTGELSVDRVIALGGPKVEKPRLLATRRGASTDDLVRGELGDGEVRVISGSVFSGRSAGGDVHGYLGRYHDQISVLEEGREREFLGWLTPGLDKFSVISTFVSKLMPSRAFDMTTTTNGSHRAIVPIGMYEKVFPFDIMPTQMMRALLMTDVEVAERLGALELDVEDVALCTFVCPGKNDYGPRLREVLTILEKEG